ncbi:MAG: hypothetical protein K2I14_01085 [Eubacterium sp.]|nr:hypothetical protein [Eubacterium sp.]
MKYQISRSLHSDFSVFEENKLAERSYFIPFSTTEKLLKSDYKNERYVSDRAICLSGEWNFAYFDKLSRIPDTFDTDNFSFDTINVPSTWQRTGYDQIAYINTRYPFPKKPPRIPQDVAVGIYQRCFNIQSSNERRILTFLGVAGALAVYINGKYAGYSEGSHNTAEFDISSFINNGSNEIVAVVYKWSNGTYLECQDMFRENGIFRDVYIIETKKNYINDFCIRPEKNIDGTYNVNISVDGSFDDDSRIKITASDDKPLFEAELLPNRNQTVPSLYTEEWSAEIPKLYEVTISLYNGTEEIEAIRTYLGFKHIEIKDEVFLFNDKAIKFKGVNHHDTHMTKGYAVSLDDLELDIKIMKEYNCNAVRTSHYPPDPAFLTMCDMYGLYVVDEADIETHGFYAIPHSTYRPNRLSNDITWANHYLDRVKRMYGRDKNHPSITMWSLGNESGGYKCQDVCYDYLKKINPEIPVHYEGVNRSKRWAYDVVSHMYASPELMKSVLEGKAGNKYKGKPFFQCEYAHAMGNGPGRLEDYMKLFYSSDRFMGGCIWEFADHSVYDENAEYKWTYGGDHNEPIHDGNFCVDGLFFPNREPSSGALEMKACYRPIRATNIGGGNFEFWNTRSFKSTDDITIDYEILENTIPIQSGSFNVDIPAEDKHVLSIECEALDKTDADIFVNFTYKNRKTGFEIAKEQLILASANLSGQIEYNPAEIKEEKGRIVVEFKTGNAVFEKKKGLISLIANGKEYINQNPVDRKFGFVPHIFRGTIDNDRNLFMFWKFIGLNTVNAKLKGIKVIDNKIRTSYSFITRGIFKLAKAYVDYTFGDNGKVYVTVTLKKSCILTSTLPRFGVHCELPSEFEAVQYYGLGPDENYSDFKEHSIIGVYETAVSDMAHKYIKPQDSGNRGETRYAAITADKGEEIRFNAVDKTFNFNANHFTLGQLIKAEHIEDIPDMDTTFASIDGFVRGTGSGSCGPATTKEHSISFGYGKPLEFTFEFEFSK